MLYRIAGKAPAFFGGQEPIHVFMEAHRLGLVSSLLLLAGTEAHASRIFVHCDKIDLNIRSIRLVPETPDDACQKENETAPRAFFDKQVHYFLECGTLVMLKHCFRAFHVLGNRLDSGPSHVARQRRKPSAKIKLSVITYRPHLTFGSAKIGSIRSTIR